MALPAEKTSEILTVGELAKRIKERLENTFGRVWVSGQVSKVTYHQSGHLYFDLKDEQDGASVISCVMWRGNVMRLKFRVETGVSVLVFGLVSAYLPRGSYQIICDQIEPKGVGALHLKFEQLKANLAKEGLFNEERKRPLPMLPRTLAIVTSPVGAVIQDMIRTITTRFPPAHILIHPVKVQGEGAAEEIAAAIGHLNLAHPEVDVMIVGRGGGSLEDLWAFNEEVVARAIFASRIPVVSAVGHETDFTISDFVADVRALTPTDAGNRVVPKLDDLQLLLEDRRSKLRGALMQRAELSRSQLDGLRESYALRRPIELVRDRSQRLDELADRLRVGLSQASAHLRSRLDLLEKSRGFASLKVLADQERKRADHLEAMMTARVRGTVASAAERLRGAAGRLESLSPLAVLGRGYSITRLEEKILRDAREAKAGDRITTLLSKGKIISNVERTDIESAP